jgi:hypothetical protein
VGSWLLDGTIHVPAQGRFVVEYREGDRVGRAMFDGVSPVPGPAIVLPRISECLRQQEPMDGSTGEQVFRSRLQVLRPDGGRWRSGVLSIHDGQSGSESRGRTFDMPADGVLDLELRIGDRVTVTPHATGELEPLSFKVQGKGPWFISWPETGVDLRVHGPDRAPLPHFVVHLGDGSRAYGVDGRLRLWRTSSGPLRMWIEASNHRIRDLRVQVQEGEVRCLTINMTER